jgi:hypothetical protein
MTGYIELLVRNAIRKARVIEAPVAQVRILRH